jgi:hypothetical protein
MVVAKANLVTEGRDKILKSGYPKTVVLEPVEIRVAGIYSGRALSNVKNSSGIVLCMHSDEEWGDVIQ